jgi:hypothetical protein
MKFDALAMKTRAFARIVKLVRRLCAIRVDHIEVQAMSGIYVFERLVSVGSNAA